MAAGGADDEWRPPPAWQMFTKGYRERFVDDCVIRLPHGGGVEVRVAQAPAGKRAPSGGGGGKQQQQQKQKPAPTAVRRPVGLAGPPVAATSRGRGRGGGRASAAGRGGSGRSGGAAAAATGAGSAKPAAAAAAASKAAASEAAAASADGREADPALTGATVWDGAIVLAQYLTGPSSCLRLPAGAVWPLSGRRLPVVLELGAGTGAVSLCLLAARAAEGVVMTDIKEMLPHLQRNVAHNARAVDPARALVAPLSWGEPRDAEAVAALTRRRWRPVPLVEVPVAVPEMAAVAENGDGAQADSSGSGGVDPAQQQQQQAGEQQQAAGEEPPPQQQHERQEPPADQSAPPSPQPPWDVICGSDLIYYTYSERTPHSRLLLEALQRLAVPELTLIALSLSLHHNPEEVARFLGWARARGFDVRRVPAGEIPEEYRVPDVLVVTMRLRATSGARGGGDGGGDGDGVGGGDQVAGGCRGGGGGGGDGAADAAAGSGADDGCAAGAEARPV